MEKKPELSQPMSPRLRDVPVELELLAIERVVGAADLIGAGRIVGATIDIGELRLKPLARRVRRLRERARYEQDCGRRKEEGLHNVQSSPVTSLARALSS